MTTIPTVRLVRRASTEQGTPGKLYAEAHHFDTLEPGAPDHDPTHPRIPTGTYLAKKVGSPKYPGRYVLQAVPFRSGIVLHPGNFAGCTEKGFSSDTDGCILIGRAAELLNHKKNRQCALILSRSTLAGFESIMEGKDFFLQVIDPPHG